MKNTYKEILIALADRDKSLFWNKQEALYGIEELIPKSSDIKKLSAKDFSASIDDFELLAGQGITVYEALDNDYKLINKLLTKTGSKLHKLEIKQILKSKNNIILNIPNNTNINISIKNITFSYWANLYIVVGNNCQVSVLDNHVSSDLAYGGGSINLVSGTNSKVEYLSLADNVGSYNFNLRSFAGKDSKHYINCVGKLSDKYYNYNISGYGINALAKNYLVSAISFSDMSKSIMNFNNIHIAANTSGDIKFKGISLSKARAQVDGLIDIGKSAFGTDSYLQEDVVMMSEDSNIVADPNLEILNNDVSASHGATIGHIDESSVFYLMSRGLSKKEAENMLISGFLRSLSKYIVNDDLKLEFNNIFS